MFYDGKQTILNAISKPLQLLKARINSGDYQMTVEAIMLGEAPENELICFVSHKQI